VPKKQEPTCRDCHFWCEIEGKDACTDGPGKINGPGYKLLKSLKVCENFWPSHQYRERAVGWRMKGRKTR
jgi:hypothetical protein